MGDESTSEAEPIDAGDPVVRAAGALVTRAGNKGTELLLIHRDRYDDWSFPKGKAEAGESAEQNALREVEEETGFAVDLLTELPTVRYPDRHGRPKEVRYWLATVVDGSFAQNSEVDEIAWLRPKKARKRLTYDRDVELLLAVADLLPTPGHEDDR